MTATFDPRRPLGRGRTVIEASAGTGKTFTIAAVVARLVAEEGIPIERILVITFTRAATAELKSRIRGRLMAVVRGLEGAAPPDDHMTALLDANDPDVLRRRVMLALTNFDRAQIQTIDGFGRRLLGELGFGSRLSGELEPGPLDRSLVAEAAGDHVIDRYAHSGDRPMPPNEAADIGAAVLARPDAIVVPDPGEVTGRAAARAGVAAHLRAEVERRLRRANQVTFADSLMEVRATLSDPDVGETARRLLAARYDAALVDEAQDTDPVQWGVIMDVFGEGRLLIIGDPKQSIYRFRGADIEAYLEAIEHADHRTLEVNWRSDEPLLDALDALFSGATFGAEEIRYHRVHAPEPHRRSRLEGAGPALSLRWFAADAPIEPRNRDDRFSVGAARRAAAGDAAAEVVRLLTSGSTILGDDGIRSAVTPSDISVLCRVNAQVDMVRAELAARGVPSVAGRSGAVFLSSAAEQWRRFLHAVEHPERMDLVRLGASSDLVGLTLRQIATLGDDQELDLQAEMRGYQRTLHDIGVPGVLAEVDRRRDVTRRMLARTEGERLMTDLTHVSEELHAAWRPGRIGSLVAWLEDATREARQRADSYEDEPESRQRRLETDAQAVQVLTIHAAKGLEFPIVLVPFGWDAPSFPPTIPVFHDPETGRRAVDVGGEWAESDRNRRLDQAEQAAEESRRLYVALTRARHHLVVWWIKNVKNAPESMLGQLLGRPEWREAARVASEQGLIGSVGLHELPETRALEPDEGGTVGLDAASFDRTLDHLWTRASFSRLSPEHPLADQGEETPDIRTDEMLPEDPAEVPAEPDLPMADLPRGARFGTMVHEILEELDPGAFDLRARIEEAVGDAIVRGGWDIDPAALTAGIEATITTPLGPEPDAPTLTGLGPVLKELVFELPVRTDDGPVSLADIGSVMAAHLEETDPIRAYTRHLHTLDAQRFRGFLTGAIDLTIEMPDGRFAVLDYKSNALSDYGRVGLDVAMIEGNYVLQSTLYQIALHRYLSWRLPGYDARRHLGGSIYLFLRGTTGPSTPVADGVRQGVHIWRPPPSMIVALSDLFESDSR